MRVAVFGVGGVGGYFGGRLAQAGETVIFIARGEHLRAMRENGLRVDSVAGDFVVSPCAATDDPAAVGPVDVVVVGVKAWQVPADARCPLRQPAAPGTAGAGRIAPPVGADLVSALDGRQTPASGGHEVRPNMAALAC